MFVVKNQVLVKLDFKQDVAVHNTLAAGSLIPDDETHRNSEPLPFEAFQDLKSLDENY